MDLISRAVVVPALASWLAALDGVAARLGAGGAVADVGCGYGAPTIAIAKAFPRSRVLGIDTDAPDPTSISAPGKRSHPSTIPKAAWIN